MNPRTDDTRSDPPPLWPRRRPPSARHAARLAAFVGARSRTRPARTPADARPSAGRGGGRSDRRERDAAGSNSFSADDGRNPDRARCVVGEAAAGSEPVAREPSPRTTRRARRPPRPSRSPWLGEPRRRPHCPPDRLSRPHRPRVSIPARSPPALPTGPRRRSCRHRMKRETQAIPRLRPRGPAHTSDSRPMPAGLANASRAPLAAPAFDSSGSHASRFAAIGERRPQAAGTGSSSSAAFASSARGDQERSAFLAAIEREANGSGKGPTGAPPDPRRPFVSAARRALPALSSGSNGSNGSNREGVDGWQEVPLDALPDCSPPGRQDLLKKRILLAAPFQRECSHRDGSYRFVETRNLGAFLMWSRPNPDGRAGQPRDRDACDVLERALACIGDRSSQESSPR